MNKENCALKLVKEIIPYYDARSKKHQIINYKLELIVATRNRLYNNFSSNSRRGQEKKHT